MSPAAICHCGRPGPYAGACFRHAEGFAQRRSRSARASMQTVRDRTGTHPLDPVKLCRKGLHRMTPENTLIDSRGKRCRACKAISNQRSIDGLATPCIRTVVLHHMPRQSPVLPHRYSPRERSALAEARLEFQAWLKGKNMLDLAEVA